MKQETGIKIVAVFDDRAAPLTAGTESNSVGTRSQNADIQMFPAIEGPAQPLAPSAPQPPTPAHLAARLAELTARIESAVEVIRAASAEVKQIQDALAIQPQNKAG